MKASLLALVFGFSAIAGTVSVPAEYEIITVKGFCKEFKCQIDEETREQKCRYKVYFEQASFDQIKQLGKEKGLRNKWFAKSPKELCEAKELPAEAPEGQTQEVGEVRVMLYSLDRSVLTGQF